MDPSINPDAMLLFSQKYGFIVQSLFFLISAIIASTSIYFSTSSAKKRAVIDYVMKEQDDEKIISAKKTLKGLHAAKDPLSQYACNNQKNSEEAKAILDILNSYEFVCAAIHTGAFHEGMYKKMQYQRLKTDHKALMPFISELRTAREHPTLFQEFEKLGNNWRKKPLKMYS